VESLRAFANGLQGSVGVNPASSTEQLSDFPWTLISSRAKWGCAGITGLCEDPVVESTQRGEACGPQRILRRQLPAPPEMHTLGEL